MIYYLYLLGGILIIIGILFNNKKTISNSLKGKNFYILILLVYISICLLFLYIIPNVITLKHYFLIIVCLGVLLFFINLFYYVKYGGALPLLDIAHKPEYIYYYLSYTILPKNLRLGKANQIQVGLIECKMDVANAPAPKRNKLIEKVESGDGLIFPKNKYDEIVMFKNTRIEKNKSKFLIKIESPIIKTTPDVNKFTLDEILSKPQSFIIYCEQPGKQIFNISIYDLKENLKGRITIHINVKNNLFFIPNIIFKIIQFIGAMLILLSTILIIIEKLKVLGII